MFTFLYMYSWCIMKSKNVWYIQWLLPLYHIIILFAVSTVYTNITLIYTNFRINFRFLHCMFFFSECVEMAAVSLDGSQKLNVNFKHICLLLVIINYSDQQNSCSCFLKKHSKIYFIHQWKIGQWTIFRYQGSKLLS